MLKKLGSILELLVSGLPGWMFLAAGVFIVGATLLIPPYLRNHELLWQRDLLQAQAQQMTRQEGNYQQFLRAIDAGDPVLIERLAFHYLRLKPEGSRVVAASALPGSNGRVYSNIDQWLRVPMPRVGVDFPAYSPIRSRLVRLTTSPARLLVIAFGVVCVALGLMSPSRRNTLTTHVPQRLDDARRVVDLVQDRLSPFRRLARPAATAVPTVDPAATAVPTPDPAVAAAPAGPASLTEPVVPVEPVVQDAADPVRLSDTSAPALGLPPSVQDADGDRPMAHPMSVAAPDPSSLEVAPIPQPAPRLLISDAIVAGPDLTHVPAMDDMPVTASAPMCDTAPKLTATVHEQMGLPPTHGAVEMEATPALASSLPMPTVPADSIVAPQASSPVATTNATWTTAHASCVTAPADAPVLSPIVSPAIHRPTTPAANQRPVAG